MANSRSLDERTDDDRPAVKAHTCSEEKTVFTEDGNADGWIATDLTVELPR
ncbi:hypothetical protein [Halapricum salinum]|uniref:hypothetical protein n=1 Tax=Halapricum salinum TaxID=1457250 RepID=UPI000A9969CE|nr:hypothetical protein [Halapricum salinum]